MMILILIACLVVMGTLSSLVQAWAASTIWRWFLAPSMGEGPTYAGWFGLACIVAILLAGSLVSLPRKEIKRERLLAEVVSSYGFLMFGFVLSVAVAWCTGQIVGWL